jgi:hypothetical protein
MPSILFHSPELLAALSQAFEASWEVLHAHEPEMGKERTIELSIDLSRRLVAFAADGVTDAEQLRTLVLRDMPLSPK